ncbi:MAG: DUF3422 family protein, partial [Pseudomonadota bacterium]
MPERLQNDPDRYALANELHARPFPSLQAPCTAVHLAIRPPEGARRDRAVDRAHLIDLIDRFGAPHPTPDAAFYMGELGRFSVKWESHTEFVAYTLFVSGAESPPFAADALGHFPDEWLRSVKGDIVAAAHVHVSAAASREAAEAFYVGDLQGCFVSESLATAYAADHNALVGSDFRLHEDGLARIGVIALDGIGPRRLGRIVQQVLEIESYKAFALRALPVARATAERVTALEDRLAGLSRGRAAEGAEEARATL